MPSWESPRSFASAWTMTNSSGFSKGRPFKNRSLIKLKMAVFMPMPSARVSTASRVKAGDLSSWRSAKRRSIMRIFDFRFSIFDLRKSLGAQSEKWIDARRAASWQITGVKRERSEHRHDGDKRERIGRRRLEKQALDRAAQ